jgi:hypothetical protein
VRRLAYVTADAAYLAAVRAALDAVTGAEVVVKPNVSAGLMALTEIPQVCASNFLTCEAWSR